MDFDAVSVGAEISQLWWFHQCLITSEATDGSESVGSSGPDGRAERERDSPTAVSKSKSIVSERRFLGQHA